MQEGINKRRSQEETMRNANAIFSRYRLMIVMAVFLIIMFLADRTFFNLVNLKNIIVNLSINGILAIGMTLLMISNQFDISIGSTMVLSGAIAIYFVNRFSPGIGIIIGISSGIIWGLINGLLVAKFQINSFIATLGTMVIYQGLTFSITDIKPITTNNTGFQQFAVKEIFSVPMTVYYFIICIIVVLVISKKTKFGKYAYAIGGNREACRDLGIAEEGYTIGYFILAGLFAAFAGVLLASKIMAASGIFGENVALLVMAGIVLGGVHLSGGVGSVLGVVQGILILGLIDNMIVYLGLVGFFQMFFRGMILLAVLILDVVMVSIVNKRLEIANLHKLLEK
jgi:ribose/xylose/arabinose/galactoside ABC-type transport system permease subunit